MEVSWATPLYELCYANFVSVDDPDDRPFCETAPARILLGSERFAKHQDDEPDFTLRDLRFCARKRGGWTRFTVAKG
jgi:hypothetical protein